jgi:hypothetical protein
MKGVSKLMPTVLWWVIHIVVTVLIFLLVQWLLPVLLGLVGVSMPERIVTIIALLLALLYLAGGIYGGWWRRVPPTP